MSAGKGLWQLQPQPFGSWKTDSRNQSSNASVILPLSSYIRTTTLQASYCREIDRQEWSHMIERRFIRLEQRVKLHADFRYQYSAIKKTDIWINKQSHLIEQPSKATLPQLAPLRMLLTPIPTYKRGFQQNPHRKTVKNGSYPSWFLLSSSSWSPSTLSLAPYRLLSGTDRPCRMMLY